MLSGLFWVVFSRVVSLGDGGKCLPIFCSGLANTFKFLHQSTHWCSINRCYPALVQDPVNSATFESSTARESLADGLQRNLLDHGSHNLLPSRHGMGGTTKAWNQAGQRFLRYRFGIDSGIVLLRITGIDKELIPD